MPSPQARDVLRLCCLFLLLRESLPTRVRKASISSLNRVKQLLNDETVRYQSSIQSDSMPVFSDITRDPNARRHHDELSVNKLEEYFQGDVDLSEKQVEIIEKHLAGTGREKRKVGRAPIYKRWKLNQPISFDFAPEIPPETKVRIRDAMRLWQRNTCVRFEENGPNVDRMEFFDGGGCSSFVGRVGGTQGISIATPGCDVIGIISHEIGHALGIFHEQARPDQERNIAVNYNNIPLSRWNNFQAVDQDQADTLNLPYDSGSVMHYGAFGFAADPFIPTIRTLDRNLQNTIGQRAGPSFLDYQSINIAYDCLSKCPPIDCQRGGYANPNNCSSCICPDGLAGATCGNVRLSNSECGGVFKASTLPQYVSTPRYPDNYPANVECYWMIQADNGGRVFLEFVDEMGFLCEDTCDKSYVEVKYHSDMRLTGARFCCNALPRRQFVSFTNEMMILMRGFGGTGKGFRAKIWSDQDPDPSQTTTAAPTTTTTTTTLPTTTTTSIFVLLPIIPPVITPPLPSLPPPPRPTPPSSTAKSSHTIKAPVTKTVKVKPFGIEAVDPPPEGSISIINDCGCSPWTEWRGECTQQCGGCGHRMRKRTCEKSTCQKEEKRACNFSACPSGTNFLINNGEVHLLWRGCCIGLFRSENECTALETNSNPFLKIISSLLTSQDPNANRTALLLSRRFTEH